MTGGRAHGRPLQDPGAQPERTALAWNRTTLSLVAAGLLCVRLAPSPGAAALGAAVVCAAVSLHLRRALLRHPGHRLRGSHRKRGKPGREPHRDPGRVPDGAGADVGEGAGADAGAPTADPVSVLIASLVTVMLGVLGVLFALG